MIKKKYKKNNSVYRYYNNQGWELDSKKNVMLDEEINVNNNSSCKR